LPNRSPYVASKVGLLGLTYTAARELGQFNIRCNAILPGSMDNPRGHALIAKHAEETGKSLEDARSEFMRFISMRTMIGMDEVASMAVFLASDAARHVSGQQIGVCGNQEYEI
jgi:NAD(P)-dependent dehydrogenase (short-subunit alcohol dehydrogenase family)